MQSPKFGMTSFRSVCLNEQLSPGEDQMSRIFMESNMDDYRLSGNPVHWTAFTSVLSSQWTEHSLSSLWVWLEEIRHKLQNLKTKRTPMYTPMFWEHFPPYSWSHNNPMTKRKLRGMLSLAKVLWGRNINGAFENLRRLKRQEKKRF